MTAYRLLPTIVLEVGKRLDVGVERALLHAASTSHVRAVQLPLSHEPIDGLMAQLKALFDLCDGEQPVVWHDGNAAVLGVITCPTHYDGKRNIDMAVAVITREISQDGTLLPGDHDTNG